MTKCGGFFSLRLGMVDPDLPPPGPPVMRSFKVSKRTKLQSNKRHSESWRRGCRVVLCNVTCVFVGVSVEHGGQRRRDGGGEALQPVQTGLQAAAAAGFLPPAQRPGVVPLQVPPRRHRGEEGRVSGRPQDPAERLPLPARQQLAGERVAGYGSWPRHHQTAGRW